MSELLISVQGFNNSDQEVSPNIFLYAWQVDEANEFINISDVSLGTVYLAPHGYFSMDVENFELGALPKGIYFIAVRARSIDTNEPVKAIRFHPEIRSMEV